MNNKTFIIIGLFICLLFTIPMVSAAEVSADSDLIDNSVIGSNINSQAIATSDVNALENNIDNVISNANIDSNANVDSNIDSNINNINNKSEIDIDDSNKDDKNNHQEITVINSGKNNKNSNDKNNLGANALTAIGDGNSFTDLKYLIDQAIQNGATSFTLPRDFEFVAGDDDSLVNGIIIDSENPFTIIGNSKTIDGKNSARIFVINSNQVTLNGITFQNGETKSTSDHSTNGGAIYVIGANAAIVNCNFNTNIAYEDGGALFIEGDDCTLNHTTFTGNVAHNDGGAIEWRGANGKINDLVATDNHADSGTGSSKGGTILCDSNNMVMNKLVISNSYVTGIGYEGGKPVQGGAIAVSGNNTKITNSSFSNCYVDYDKDDLNASGGALYVWANNVSIANCNFTNNHASEDGGALFIEGENCTMNHTVFKDNFAHNDGGAVEWRGDNGKIYDLNATGNYADSGQGSIIGDTTKGSSKGGTILVAGNNISLDKLNISNSNVSGEHYTGTKPIQGGAIAVSGSYNNITNSVFTNCSVLYEGDNCSGGALYIWGNHSYIYNCNFTNNSASEDGGAIFIEGENCTLNTTVFIGNVAHNDGGAIQIEGNKSKIYNLTADKNYADSSTGSSQGGTIIITGNSTSLDVISISNSYADGSTGRRAIRGGAIFLTGNDCNITNASFTNCSVKWDDTNCSGGAMYIMGNDTQLINVNFTNSTAPRDGGAIYVLGDDLLVSSCEFVNNTACVAGGSIFWEGSRGIVEYSHFTGNRALGNQTGTNSGRGGSILWLGDRGEVRECAFNDSISKNEGSILYIKGNDIAAYNSNFTDSQSLEKSGTVYIEGTYAKIGDCYFDNNTVKENGGGIFVKGNFISISGTTINNSSSGNSSSAVYVEGNRTEIKNSLISNNNANDSGAVYIAGSRSTISNVNFENNTAKTSAGAIYVSGDDTIITESNFTNNTAYKGGAILYVGERITISYSNFTHNRANGTNEAKGGSISIKGKSGDSIIGCTFKDSSSGSSGGSIHWLAGGKGGLIQNCTFINSSTDGLNIQGQGHGGAIIWEENTNGVIDNCTFIDCVAKGTKNAGAIYMGVNGKPATNPVISNCVIVNCTNGERGTINIFGINATLENITFANMSKVATSNRGFHAIEFEKLTTGRVINCTFENIGGSYEAGAIKVDSGSDIVIANNTFFNVSSTSNGGAVYTTGVSGYQIIENNTFINNTAVGDGGAAYFSRITSFKNNTFINNTISSQEKSGGAIYVPAGTLINNSTFIHNGGEKNGGAIYSPGSITVNNSTFYDNYARLGGGAILSSGMTVNGSVFVNNTALGEDGGALLSRSTSNVYIINSTFLNNTAFNQGGAVNSSGTVYVNESSTFKYNNATSGSAIRAKNVNLKDVTLLENQASFDQWTDLSNSTTDSGIFITGVLVGKDNILNAIMANGGTYSNRNVIYCGVNGGGLYEDETTNTNEITSARSYNEVHQIIYLEIYDFENNLVDTIYNFTDENGKYEFNVDLANAKDYYYKIYHPEDNYYTGAEYSIGRSLSNLTIHSQNITHPEDEIITFDVTGIGGTDIPTGNITVYINDTYGNVIYDNLTINIGDSITLQKLNATEYYIYARYNGDENYLPYNETSVFHVDMADSFINIGIENYTYNETRNITITVPYIESGKISIIVSDDDFTQSYTVYITEGTEEVKVELPILDAGEYNIEAIFHGNNNYYPSQNTTNFTVYKAASIINVTADNVTGGEKATANIHIGPEVATQNVNVTVYDAAGNIVDEYEDLGLLDSRVSQILKLLPKGKYNITVTYPGDKNHNESVNSTIFYVTNDLFPIEINASNMTYGEDQIINITVPANANPDKLWIKLNWTGNKTVTDLGLTIDENGVIRIDTSLLSNRLDAGNYTIDVFYEGDDDYLSNSSSSAFEVTRADVEMTVTPQNITYTQIENITVEIPKLNEIGQNDALALYVNNTNDESIRFIIEDYDIGTDGKAIWNINNAILPAGEYTVEVVYAGSNNYNPTNRTERFTVSKVEAWIEIVVNNIFVGDDEVINITVYPNGQNGVTGNITLYVRDIEETIKLNATGQATYTLPNEVEGTGITVLVLYNGDNNYNSTRNSTHYNVTKRNTTTTIEGQTPIPYGSIENLTITVNETAVTGTINLYVNSTVNGFENITKVFDLTETDLGKVKWNSEGKVLPAGTYYVTAVYSGDTKYNGSTGTYQFVVKQNDDYSVIVEANNTIYRENQVIVVTVPDDAEGTVTIVIEGTSISLTENVENGKAVFTIPNDQFDYLEVQEDYKVIATYNGDDNYASGVTGDDLFNVTKAESHIKVVAEDIDYAQIENITVSLPDANATGKLVITITNKTDGSVITTKTVDSFTNTTGVIYPFGDLLAGNYTVKVEYSGDHNYNDSEDSYDFEVRKVNPTLTENSPDIIYGADENITVKITGAEGGETPTGTIEVLVDGVSVKTITIGQENLEYIVTKPGVDPKHNVTVIYSGDNNYSPVTITGEFAVSQNSTFEITEDSPNIVYGNNETIKITLPDDATGTVYLVVNGSYYTPIGIDANHQAIFNIVAPIVGDYTFTAYYSGDGNYTAKNIDGEFKVTKADVNLAETHAATITYGNNDTITVTITGVEGPEGVLAPTGTIKVLVDGDELDNITIGNDLVFTSIKPFVDSQHNITIIYSGDNNYNDKTLDNSVLDTLVFEVTQNNNVEISEESPDINYTENETITVTIAGDATGDITVTVGGEQVGQKVTITEVTEDAKSFTFNITKPDGGVYDDLTVVYSGDSNYGTKTITGEFTVKPIEPDITEDSPNIVYTNNENIVITVPEGATGTLTVTVKNSKGQAIVDGKVLTIGVDNLEILIEKPNVDNYTISIEYSGCDNYTAKTISGEFNVTKASSDITVVPTNITYGQTETITVTVPEGATGSVTITVGTYTDTLPITEGNREVVFTIPKADDDPLLKVNENYVVFANYSGDDNFESAVANAPFHVDPANTTVTVQVANITYGEDEIINVTVTGVNGGEIPTGFVTITINGTDFESTKPVDSDGKAQFNVSGLVVGEYSVNATFASTSINYKDSNGTAKFNVSKADVKEANMNISAVNITYGDDETITVTLNENNITGNVTITINGTEIETKELKDGKVVFTVPDLEVNGYNVVANYSGDANYNAIAIEDNFNADFKVDKANVTVEVTPVDIVYKQTEEINVTVTGVVIDDQATGIDKYNLSGKVTIYIDGVENQTLAIDAADANGVLHFNVEGLAVGKHNVTAKYWDDRNYNENNDTKDFEVLNALPENMQVIPQNITYHIETETITVDLGEPLTGTIELYINGTLVKTFNVADEQTVTYTNDTLAVGNYTAKAKFTANGDSVEVSANFTVSKAPTKVTVEAENSTYGDTQTITVTVDNTVPDKFNLTGNVSITINGVDYGNKTVDANGQAVFEIDGLEANDNYVVIATYYNDPNYENNNNDAKFKVDKADVKDESKDISAINITYGEDETITVTLDEKNITGNVTITINGTPIETKELEDGKVVFTVKDLEVNEYNVVANYSGDTNYNPFTISDNLNADFTVGKANSTVTVEAIPSIVYGNNETITVTVPIRNHTGTITLTINGTDYQFIKQLTAEDSDTIVLTNVSGLAVGLYNVTVKYDNDRNYNDSEDSALFEVTKATPTQVAVSPQNITYTEDEIITVTVGDDYATGKITIRIEGTNIVKEAELDKGEAKFNVTGLVVDHYTVIANYSGDSNYTSVEVSAPFRVDKAASNVTIEVENITYGEIEYANITIPNYNATGRAIIKVDGKAYDTLPLTNDTPINLDLSGLAAGIHTIDVEYFDDENYNKSIAHAEFNVTKATIPVDPDNESSLKVVPTDINYLDNETIVVSVGVNNATGIVNITIKDKDNKTVVLDGSVVVSKNITSEGSQSVTFTVPGLVVGDYTVEVKYADDPNYEDAEISAPFTVSPANSTVTVEAVNITYLENETITVTVPISNASGKVVIKVNGTSKDERTVSGDNPSYNITIEGLAVGEYNVTVEYSDDPNYNSSNASTLFHVDKADVPDANMTVVPTNITYLDDETITVTVNVTNATGKVTITINGTDVELTDDVDKDGKVTFTVPGLVVGEYNVTAKYHDDPNYNDAESSALFTVSPAESSVTVVPTNITYNDDETITVTVPITNATGKVTIVINGTEVETKDVGKDGKVTFSVPGLVVGEYNVTAKYHDDPNYNDSESSALFHVDKDDIANMDVSAANITYGDNETITINIGDNNATGNITIKVNGTEYGPQGLVDGSTTFNVPGLVAGDYEVAVSYSGDDNYNATTANADFTVEKATPNVYAVGTNITYGDEDQITAIVDGKNITGNVTIYIDDEPIETVDLTQTETGGRAILNVPGLSAGNHTVKVVYNGDDNHYPNEAVDNFTVRQAKPTMEINTDDIDYGETENINVTIAGIEGGVTPTGTVNVTVTGDNGVTKTFTRPINPDGTVSVPVEDLPVGSYNVTVSYPGDENYTAINGTSQFTVGKIDPTVNVNADNITYGETETIEITVPKDATGTVNVTVTDKDGNNRTFTDLPVGKDGTVSVPVDNLAAGDYDVAVDYSGDKNHNPASAKASFSVDKVRPGIVIDVDDIDYHDSEDIVINVTGVEGGVTPTGDVTVTVTDKDGNNQTFTKPISSDGTVSLSIDDLPAGDYKVTVEYPGDENYTSVNGSDSFTVNKINTPVDLETEDIIYGDDETLAVTVPEDATGNVTITIKDKDGKVVSEKTVPVSSGTAELTVPGLNAGNYTVHVDYLGDNNYVVNSTDGKFEVSKANATVEIHVYDIYYGDIEELTVTCNAPGNVTIYVNGAEITLPLENGYAKRVFANELNAYSGKAQWDLENLAVGTYPARVHYNGNENYNEADDDDVFHVIKLETAVNVTADDIKVGEEEEITVEFAPEEAPGQLTITVTDSDGNVVHTENVTPVNGKASIIVTGLKEGTHNVTVSYPGSQNYTNCSNSTTFSVGRSTPNVSLDSDDIKVGDDETITVTVPDDATGNVTITVDGKDYTAPVQNGKAVFTVPGLKAGNYTVDAKYSGDDKYVPRNATGNFTVSKYSTNVSLDSDDIKVGDDETITVTVPEDATGTVTIEIDGKEYTAEVKDGKAVFTVPGLKAGDYTVKAHYSGDAKYLPSDLSDEFTVSKVKPDINTVAPAIVVGEDGKVTVTVPEDATGTITIEVDGKKYTAVIKDGKAVFTVPGLKTGKYPIKVHYSGDDKYESATVDGGYIEVIPDNATDHGQKSIAHNGIDLESYATGNPIFVLLLVFAFLGFIPLRRKKDDEEDEDNNS